MTMARSPTILNVLSSQCLTILSRNKEIDKLFPPNIEFTCLLFLQPCNSKTWADSTKTVHLVPTVSAYKVLYERISKCQYYEKPVIFIQRYICPVWPIWKCSIQDVIFVETRERLIELNMLKFLSVKIYKNYKLNI